jgi:transcription termination factor NusA
MEILEAFGQLTREKALEKSEIVELVKVGMLAAVRRKYGAEAEAEVLVDPVTGEISIYMLKEIVADEEVLEDPSRQMTVEEAKQLPFVNEPWGDDDPVPGQVAEIPLDYNTFGRNAIQAAKQMIIQKVREEERNRIREEYADRVGELVSGTVQQVDRGNALVFLDRRTEALLPGREQVRREYLRQGETVRALLLDIRETNKGPQLILSRTHPDFVRALFALEVPEVFQGIVEIRAIAREPGSRSKIAVWSRDQHVDPVGACVGLKGSRVQAVVSELGGERIDIVPWTDESREFIAQALSPAEVYKIMLHEPEGGDEGGLFTETAEATAFKPRSRFRGPTAAPAPSQPASPEETAAALEASKASLEEAARRETERMTDDAEVGLDKAPIEEAEVDSQATVEAAPDQNGEEATPEPAEGIASVDTELPEKRATVVCAEDQLSLAIGRSGQNVRLASKLTGYRIDLVSKAEYLAQEEEVLFGRKPEAEAATAEVEPAIEAGDFALDQVPGITAETVEAMASAGYKSFDDIIDLELEDLAAVPGMTQEAAELLTRVIDELTVEVEEEWDEDEGEYVPTEPEPDEPSTSEGVSDTAGEDERPKAEDVVAPTAAVESAETGADDTDENDG